MGWVVDSDLLTLILLVWPHLSNLQSDFKKSTGAVWLQNPEEELEGS